MSNNKYIFLFDNLDQCAIIYNKNDDYLIEFEAYVLHFFFYYFLISLFLKLRKGYDSLKLSERQKKIVEIVKIQQPVSGERISELLDISRATLRSDLSFLTLVGILKATPKIGYTYSGSDLETLFFFDTFQKDVADIMTSPVLVTHDSYIQDAIITLFMYDADVLYVIDEDKLLLGIMSRKDLLRASLNSNIDSTPVAVCMTRMPHIITCNKEMNILEAAALLQDHSIDSLPVVEEKNDRKIVGSVTKSALLDYIIQHARSAEMKREEG